MNERPTHLDLFSGIGGFSIAAEAAGFQTIGFSEIEPYPCGVLRSLWPDVPNYGNIDLIPTYWLRGVDLLTGGFPCQPFSFAGKRRGSKDDRALWPKMFRVIAETRPAWVLGENVLGIVNMELDRCLSDLESLGYTARPLVVPACAVDAKHIRKRVWIVAYAGGNGNRHIREERSGLPDRREAETDNSEWNGCESRSGPIGSTLADADGGQRIGTDNEICSGRNATDRSGQTLADSSIERTRELPERRRRQIEASTDADGSGEIVSNPKIERRLQRRQDAGRNGEGTGTQEEWRGLANQCRWPTEPELGRVAHGIPNRSHRLKGLGNAIVPQVAEVFLRAIYQQLRP